MIKKKIKKQKFITPSIDELGNLIVDSEVDDKDNAN